MDKSFSIFKSDLLYIYTIFYRDQTFVHTKFASRDFSVVLVMELSLDILDRRIESDAYVNNF